jgi:hypothetical protein
VEQAIDSKPAVAGGRRDGMHDFDFLIGGHRIRNVRFTGRLDQSGRWDGFEALSHAAPLPHGTGHIATFTAEGRHDYGFTTLRCYDAGSGRWMVHRMDNRNGLLLPSLSGAFEGGVGVFEGWQVLDQRRLPLRQTWSQITPFSARCEQALSFDSGRSWQTDWIMRYNRIEQHGPDVDDDLGIITELMFRDPAP